MANLAHRRTLKDKPDATGAGSSDQQIASSNAGAIDAQKKRLVPELIPHKRRSESRCECRLDAPSTRFADTSERSARRFGKSPGPWPDVIARNSTRTLDLLDVASALTLRPDAFYTLEKTSAQTRQSGAISSFASVSESAAHPPEFLKRKITGRVADSEVGCEMRRA
jgi:hypothetical protein